MYTTRWREWWGWFGVVGWLFFMLNTFDMLPAPESDPDFESRMIAINGGVDMPHVFFAVLFALSIFVFAWWFGRNPDRLSKIAFFTTPAVIAITAIFALLPQPTCFFLYAIAPVFMAPALVRRVYGVIHTASPGYRFIQYMSGIAICIFVVTMWAVVSPPKEITFLVAALFVVPAWVGIRRPAPPPCVMSKKPAPRVTGGVMILLAAAIVVLYWLDLMATIIHSNIIAAGDEMTDGMLMILGIALPPVGFMLYAFASDKGRERIGFICGIVLFLIGIQLAFLTGAQSLLLPLTITDGLGGAYTEFFLLTAPLYFLAGAKRPVFIASLGIILNMIASAIGITIGGWMPAPLLVLDTPLLLSASVAAIVFIALAYILFLNRREKTLAAALSAFLSGEETENFDAGNSGAPELQSRPSAGFSEEEKKIALLLIEGYTRSDILRKLHMNAADVVRHEKAIRQKILYMGDTVPVITRAVEDNNLTRREAEILQLLLRGMTNPEISAELFISEATAKFHVRNLLAKMGMGSRYQLIEWAAKSEEASLKN